MMGRGRLTGMFVHVVVVDVVVVDVAVGGGAICV